MQIEVPKELRGNWIYRQTYHWTVAMIRYEVGILYDKIDWWIRHIDSDESRFKLIKLRKKLHYYNSQVNYRVSLMLSFNTFDTKIELLEEEVNKIINLDLGE